MDYEEEQEEQAEPQAAEEVVDDTPYLSLRGAREEQAYALLKDRVFAHTRGFDPALMEKTGMNLEFASIWNALGWEEFAPVTELGSRPLTIQFLCSLTETPDGIEFRLCGTDYRLSWKDLSRLLGFSPRCAVSLKRACEGYVRESFWADISDCLQWQVCTSVQRYCASHSPPVAQVAHHYSLSTRGCSARAQ